MGIDLLCRWFILNGISKTFCFGLIRFVFFIFISMYFYFIFFLAFFTLFYFVLVCIYY